MDAPRLGLRVFKCPNCSGVHFSFEDRQGDVFAVAIFDSAESLQIAAQIKAVATEGEPLDTIGAPIGHA